MELNMMNPLIMNFNINKGLRRKPKRNETS